MKVHVLLARLSIYVAVRVEVRFTAITPRNYIILLSGLILGLEATKMVFLAVDTDLGDPSARTKL